MVSSGWGSPVLALYAAKPFSYLLNTRYVRDIQTIFNNCSRFSLLKGSNQSLRVDDVVQRERAALAQGDSDPSFVVGNRGGRGGREESESRSNVSDGQHREVK